jgi:hypothetical protein
MSRLYRYELLEVFPLTAPYDVVYLRELPAVRRQPVLAWGLVKITPPTDNPYELPSREVFPLVLEEGGVGHFGFFGFVSAYDAFGNEAPDNPYLVPAGLSDEEVRTRIAAEVGA